MTRFDRIRPGVLSELLEVSGLVTQPLAQQAGQLAGRFPSVVQGDLFLEFEFGEEAVAAGFGIGFSAGTLDHFRVVQHAFLATTEGRSLEAAFADDPFEADHREHLNLFGDADPDWVEYDVSDGLIDPTPFVFFRVPSRLRRIASSDDVHDLCATLPGRGANADFESLLNRILTSGPAFPYRVGVARSRGPRWWRAIISGIDRDQVVAAIEVFETEGAEGLLEPAARLYEHGMDQPGACFALSIDAEGDRITAVDVECPYLFRISDPDARRVPFFDYSTEIVASGIVSAANAAWMNDQVFRDVALPKGDASLRILLHHLKFRLIGEPYLRTKAYLHLGLTAGSEPAARG